jgi:hypothetical protein
MVTLSPFAVCNCYISRRTSSIIKQIMTLSPSTVTLLIFLSSIYGINGESDLFLDHKLHNVDTGNKHLDLHDIDQHALHGTNNLNDQGKDKSTTTTVAVLTANMNAVDQHQDSYSHLHDNAHETDFGADHDVLLGNEAIEGHEIDDEGVDYIEPVEYEHHHEYPHEDHTHDHVGYVAPDYSYSDGVAGVHGPMVHAGVHGSVHPSVHGRHMPVGHHQRFVDGGFVPTGVHHDMRYLPEHSPNSFAHSGPGMMPRGAHPYARRRYLVRAAQPSEGFIPHNEFNDVHDIPWVAAGQGF